MVASDTMNIAKRFTSIFAVLAVSASLGAAVPAASAGSAMADTTVTATRSFPKTTAAKRDFLAEHTSTDVESNADWGGIESLDVPQTESQAEKDRKCAEINISCIFSVRRNHHRGHYCQQDRYGQNRLSF